MWELSKTCLLRQTFPKDKIVWIILDNSDEGTPGWSAAKDCTDLTILYERIPPGKPLGELRNICMQKGLATSCEFFAWWDDDDYYLPQRFETSMDALRKNPSASLVICREMHVFLTQENILLKVGPYPEHQGTCASYFVRRSYIEANQFDPKAEKGEETSFCRKWRAKTVSVDPKDVLLVVGHPINTVDKSQVYTNQRQFMADVVNEANGKNIVRYQWIRDEPVWDLFYRTHLSEDGDRARTPPSTAPSLSDPNVHTESDSKSDARRVDIPLQSPETL
jgi:hypothetical protein